MGTNKGLKKADCSPLQLRFVELYGDPRSKTFGQITKSYIAAGYKNGSGAASSASTLLNNPKIVQRLQKYTPDEPETTLVKQEISKDYALSCLQTTYDQAKLKKDIPAQVACVRLMMQYNGLLVDRMVISQEESIELDEQYQSQYRQIASILVQNKGLCDKKESRQLQDRLNSDTPDVVVERTESGREPEHIEVSVVESDS